MKLFLLLTVSFFVITIAHAQNVGVGISTPAERLDVAGNIKTTGEIKPNGASGQAGEVLTSKGDGTMQWSALTSNAPGGNGGWGDCSIYNIDSLRMVANGNAQPNDNFGRSVSMSGDYAIVGAFNDDEGGLTDNGSATIYKYNAVTGHWENQGKLTNPNPVQTDLFGCSVSISGDYAIVGAYWDDEGGFNANGSATIFKRNAGTGIWESQGKLTNPNGATNDYFGFSVAISGNYAIVGAFYDDEGGFTDNGSATIFKRNATSGVWESQGKLINPNPQNGDNFGIAVSISGDYAIVGAYMDDEDGSTDCGSVTIFKRNSVSGVWESQGKLIDPNNFSTANLGTSVSISGDYAVVGIPGEDLLGITDQGAAIIFKRNTDNGVWQLQSYLRNFDPQIEDNFGSSVSINGDYIMVGASKDDENGGIDNGSVTIFKRIESIWYPHQKFTNPGPPVYGTRFGYSVCIAPNNRFMVSAPNVSSNTGMVFFGKAK